MSPSNPIPVQWPVPETMIPELLRAAPGTRAVLDKYGLRGCGGAWGPQESLQRFAHAHDVPLEPLLEELHRAVEQSLGPAVPSATPDEQLADTIYRPFFRAGIAVTLTLGAAWGVFLLLRIAWTGTFAAATLHEVNAHGHAQIFGWVGLFVMGFAYQAFSRFKHTDLAHPRWAYASGVLMLAGLTVRSLSEPLTLWYSWVWPLPVAASSVEIAAIGIFVWVVVATLRSSPRRLEVYDYYILSALVWFVVQAVWETVYLAATFQAVDREHLLALVATWQGPLREIQVHGFATLMILGVSQRLFHYFYDLPAPNPQRSRRALVALNAAVAGIVAGLVLMQTAGHAWASLWYGSVLLLAGAAVYLVRDWRIFSRPDESDRSLKFLRAAYVWLFIALGMLVFLPAYQFGLLPWLAPESGAHRIGFSHAYYGAIRHASTVGFISLMIVGVAAKVVPVLNGLDVRKLGGLWAPFLLINTGCAIRVVFQALTDFTPAAYPISGVSGLLELTGLAIWGVGMWRIMAGRVQPEEPAMRGLPVLSQPCSAPQADSAPALEITARSLVGEVLDRRPQLLEVFLAQGFTPLKNPVLRHTVARRVTIAEACRHAGAELEPFLAALNAAVSSQESNPVSAVLSSR